MKTRLITIWLITSAIITFTIAASAALTSKARANFTELNEKVGAVHLSAEEAQAGIRQNTEETFEQLAKFFQDGKNGKDFEAFTALYRENQPLPETIMEIMATADFTATDADDAAELAKAALGGLVTTVIILSIASAVLSVIITRKPANKP